MKRGDPQGDIPEVTAKQIEVFGRRFLGRRVKMSNCKFSSILDKWDVEYLENGLTQYGQDMPNGGEDRWIGFDFSDAKHDHFYYAYASFEQMGELIVSIDFMAPIHVEGVIGRLYDEIHKDDREFYGLVVDKLVVIGDLDELEW